eukprot:PITA_25731
MDQDTPHINKDSDGTQDFSFVFDNGCSSDCALRIELMSNSEGNGGAWDASTKSFGHDTVKEKRGVDGWNDKIMHDDKLELENRHLTFHIRCSEEEAFMNVLRFMHQGTLQLPCTAEVLDVLILALKMDVTRCVDYCLRELQSSMTTDSALHYLQLPPTMLTNHRVQSLKESAEKFLVEHLGYIEKHSEELLDLPLAGIEVVLSSDELRVESEDALYDFVISWARKHYPSLEQRREILGSNLCKLIRFPNMTTHKLKDVLSCDDLDNVCASNVVSEALLLKVDAPHKILNERVYQHFPVTVVEFDDPIKESMVFWYITKDSCSRFFRDDERLYSLPFLFCGAKFRLSVLRESDQFLTVVGEVMEFEEEDIEDFDRFQVEYGVREQPSCEFQVLGRYTCPADAIRFSEDITLLSEGDDSGYLINNRIYFRFSFRVE